MSTLLPSDSLSQKTDGELLFLAQHPELYHADLIAAARRELRRRGISPDPAQPEPLPRENYILPYQEEQEPSLWQRPTPWVVLLAVLLVGGILYWKNMQSKATQAVVAQQEIEGPIELETVETHLIPTFDSLTRTQIAQEMRQLSPAARSEDTTATRKYRLLATRYWNAENQSAYLFKELKGDASDVGLAKQAPVVIEEWRRLTKALVYNHGLTATLAERMDLMRRAAYLRIETLQEIARRAQNDQVILDPDITNLADSAAQMRESLLSREKWNGRLRRATF
ncbi:hypothetical protein [Hymenobacter volaticus]|uniref:DUF4129 domain-containing protein n=1 Tax=Hymenobacter volaticus TaxID=2932254 RepID=A0ABY4G2P2_9BACT|nr:hypothetical protein [Hymenobacter volaticus]UOQ65144.1 hypothetical protein MUN86_16495 [Hymenobacter volaticus]